MPELVVTLLKATDLPASDFDIAGGKSDPYVVFKLGGQELRSSRQNKTINPVWHPAERFEFEIMHVRKDVLMIEIYDQDTWDRDDKLATLAIPVSRFEDQSDKIISETMNLDVPENFSNQNRNSTITLEFCLKLHEGGARTLRIWENEKYFPTQGWKPCDSNDRKQWSSHDESRSSCQFEEVAPDVPPHHDAKGWGYSMQRGDDQGWEYASTWSGPWSGKSGTLTYVRRRQWENLCEPSS